MNGRIAWLLPCPGCGKNAVAHDGHHLCLRCEGVKPITIVETQEVPADQSGDTHG